MIKGTWEKISTKKDWKKIAAIISKNYEKLTYQSISNMNIMKFWQLLYWNFLKLHFQEDVNKKCCLCFVFYLKKKNNLLKKFFDYNDFLYFDISKRVIILYLTVWRASVYNLNYNFYFWYFWVNFSLSLIIFLYKYLIVLTILIFFFFTLSVINLELYIWNFWCVCPFITLIF